MPGQISVTIDPVHLLHLQSDLKGITNGLPKAIAGAINDTTKDEKVVISRKIRDRVNIKKRDIDPYITTKKATPSNLTGLIILSETKRIPLIYFKARFARKSRRGVSYQIAVDGGRKTLPHAFIAQMKSGHEGVFQRVGKKRLPIEELKGPSPWGVFVKSGLEHQTILDVQVLLKKNLNERTNFLLLRASGAIPAGRGG